MFPSPNTTRLKTVIRHSYDALKESALALMPIAVVIAFFQLVLLRQPIPNLGSILAGTLMVLVGLALAVRVPLDLDLDIRVGQQ